MLLRTMLLPTMQKQTTLFTLPARLSAVAIAVLLTGCSLAPDYQQPEMPVAAQWATGSNAPQTAANAEQPAVDWQTFVTDPGLRQLITLAQDNNRDLRQTLLNVAAARAQYGIQAAERLPTVQLQGSAARQRTPADLRSAAEPAVQSSYQLGAGLTAFELDVFGRVKNLTEAALQQYLATEATASSAQISLVADTIAAYLRLDGARQRYELATRTRQTREVSLELVKQRQKRGAASELDYQDALSLLQQAEVAQQRIEREQQQARNALTLLTGVADIQPYLAETAGKHAVLQQELSAGTPSTLLARRPDIVAAEHRLRSQNASIGAARAAFFPRISLTGLFGVSSAELSDLFGSDQHSWSFSPQLTLPIFDAGRNSANLDLAKVRKDIAVAAYEQTIQVAFREVSDALVATDTLRREERAQQVLALSSTERLRLSQARYQHGVDDYLRYLDAQREDFSQQMALVQIETQRQIALADLFRALGGGWSGSNAIDTGQAAP